MSSTTAPTMPRPSVQTKRSVSESSGLQVKITENGDGGGGGGGGMTTTGTTTTTSLSPTGGGAGGGGGGAAGGPGLPRPSSLASPSGAKRSVSTPPLHPSTAAAASAAAGGGQPQPSLREALAAANSASAAHSTSSGGNTTTSQQHRPNLPSTTTIDSDTLLQHHLATHASETQTRHGLDFHDDDSSMGSVVLHYALGSTPPAEYDLPRSILGAVGARGRADTGESYVTNVSNVSGLSGGGGGLSNPLQQPSSQAAAVASAAQRQQQQQQQQIFQQKQQQHLAAAGGSSHDTINGHAGNGAASSAAAAAPPPTGEKSKRHRWGSELGINAATSMDDDDGGGGGSSHHGGGGPSPDNSLHRIPSGQELDTTSREEEEVDRDRDKDRVLPYHERVRLMKKAKKEKERAAASLAVASRASASAGRSQLNQHQRQQQQQAQQQQPQPGQRQQQQAQPQYGAKPPLSPTKPAERKLAIQVVTTTAVASSSASAATAGSTAGTQGQQHQQQQQVSVPPMPGLAVANGVGGGGGGGGGGTNTSLPDDRPPLHPPPPTSTPPGGGRGKGGWFGKLTSLVTGHHDKSSKYGSMDDDNDERVRQARKYHDKNQAFLKRTERHRQLVRSGNVDFVPGGVGVGGGGGVGVVGTLGSSGHSRNRSGHCSATLDSIASLSSDDEGTTTDDDDEEERAGAAAGSARGTRKGGDRPGKGARGGNDGGGARGGGDERQPLLQQQQQQQQPLSKEEEFMRRIRELEAENARLLRMQGLERGIGDDGGGYEETERRRSSSATEQEQKRREQRLQFDRTVKGRDEYGNQGIAMTDPTNRHLTADPTVTSAKAAIARREAEIAAENAKARKQSTYYRDKFKRRIRRKLNRLRKSSLALVSSLETFFSNLPLTVGAMAMSYVTLGVVWFKYYEENDDSCVPAHFHAVGCTFPEFPGCFDCDRDNFAYRLAIGFHYICSTISGLLVGAVLLKLILARRVVLDDLANPTSSAPYGLLFMSSVCVFAGRGWIGEFIVLVTCALHLALTLWFTYSVRAYNLLPDPSWYPNMVGIGYPAVKMWLYHPYGGFFLMAVSFSSMIILLPISVFRVFLNRKISAPVCWIQMSAPSIVLYTLTIMAQPITDQREENLDAMQFQSLHHRLYLPLMHFMFALCLVGVLSSVWALYTRWGAIRKKEFSPAHAAFCFPTLSHANAMQAYRGAINSFSTAPPGSPYKIFIYWYWVFVLCSGTVVLLILSVKFFARLPQWTQIEVESPETEPPKPNETLIHEVVDMGERMMDQAFVNPAVLQANETGALVRRKKGSEDMRGKFVRTRNLTALGFEPIMRWGELQEEIEILLEAAAKNPPRRRKGWLSVPGIDFGGNVFGTDNAGVYDVGGSSSANRRRIQSDDVNRLSVHRSQSAERSHRQQDSDHMYMWG